MRISNKGKYYGAKNIELSLDKILLSQYNYSIETTPWHYHENPYFMFVLHGEMIDNNKKVQSYLPAGSLMFNNWQEQHFGKRHSAEAAGFHVEFERSWIKENSIDRKIFEGSQKIDDPNIQLLLSKLYYEFLIADKYSEVAINLLLLRICDSIGLRNNTVEKTVPSWVNRLKEILHYDSTKFSLKSLSEELGVHPVHISRAAPKYLSVSLGEYVRKLKLRKAMSLLLDSNLSLVEIAYQAGFSDQSNFNHVFKSYYKLSPGSFRRKVRIKT